MNVDAAGSTALFTDRYELTMVSAALRSGVAQRRAAFEVFTRQIPAGRPAGVVAGTARVLEAVEAFRFDGATIDRLRTLDGLGDDTLLLDWLRAYRFGGTIVGFDEGELFAANCPILTVESTFAEAVVLETLILSILNHDCAVAAAALQLSRAAGGRPLIEMGSRRTDPNAAVAAARAAAIGGFASTSNLAAGLRYGIATAGTAAHSFVLAHESEAAAFDAQLAALGADTTLLVDTFDTETGVRAAVAASNRAGAQGPGAIRIDSGDLALEAKRARALLDELGATRTRIVISGDLDSERVAELSAAKPPIDAFGIGTSVVTGDGHPTAALTYKLVAVAGADGESRSVAKRSPGKSSSPGMKRVSRRASPPRGERCVDLIETVGGIEDVASPARSGRALQRTFSLDGSIVFLPTVASARERLQASLLELGSQQLESRFADGPELHS